MKAITIVGFVAGMLVIGMGTLPAQDSVRLRPFQLSFVTPLGTNGLQSWNTVNRISINLFAGYSAGLRGVELAGFANVVKGEMLGIQMAGFCNNTIGPAYGLELAGFSNYNQGRITGLQLSGFANVALDSVAGIQGSGFANIADGDVSGIQASGFANITTGTQSGVQASGFFNYARRLNGVQVGVVNVADTVERGIPVGFLSFVRHGYHVVQIGGNETLYGEISYKTGVRRFYNILAVGASVIDNNMRWGFGYGIGTLIPVGKRFDISIEGVSYHLNENSWFNGYLNSLNRLNVSACYQITRYLGAYAGVSANVWVTHGGHDFDHHYYFSPEVSMYPGFQAGIRLGM